MHRALAALLVLLLAVISVAVATFEVGIPGGDLAAAGSFQKVGKQVVQGTGSTTEQDAQRAACKLHAVALSHLAILPSLSTPSSPIAPGPQVFLQLSTASSLRSSNVVVRLVIWLRDRYWREGYNARQVNGGMGLAGGKGGKKKREEVIRRIREVERLLEEAVEGGCEAAWETRGKFNLFPPAPMIQNLTRGLESYQKHVDLTGAPSSHSVLAFFHASSYGSLVLFSPATALVHWTFAALAPRGHQGAEAALGWRNWAGVGVEAGCEQSLVWWERAARRSYQKFISGPPGGLTLPPTPVKLSDLALGAYGLSSSAASSGHLVDRAGIKAGLAREGGETWEDIVEYYRYQAERGGLVWEYRLARIYYTGSIYNARGGLASGPEGVGLLPYQSFIQAHKHFLNIARGLWPLDAPQAGRKKHNGKAIERFPDPELTEATYLSASMLGRMYLRSEIRVKLEGERADGSSRSEKVQREREKERLRLAKLWLERAAEFDEKEAQNNLGILFRDGLGVKQDIKRALNYFQAAAGQDLAEAQVNLAKYHLSRNEVHLATNFLHQGVRSGSPLEAYYHLGLIYASSARASLAANTRPETCGAAIAHLKQVAERGCWDEEFGGWLEADRNWERGETDKAILGWWMAGERGVESAQNNLAFLLDQDTPAYSVPWRRVSSHNETAKIAMNHWMRSAAQDNVDALVKLGDYHYKGLTGEAPQMEQAAGFYQAAAESQISAMAHFNLGHMYEHGLGVPQDWHLAKRHYDNALNTNPDAALPVNLALIRLYARSIWASFTGQPQRALSLWSSDKPSNEPFGTAFLDSIKEGLKGWSLTNDELEEEQTRGVGRPAGERAEGRDFDAGDWVGMSDHDQEFDYDDEAWIESFLLVALCIFVAFLSWLRNRWARQQVEERTRLTAAAAAPPNGQQPPAAPPAVPPPGVPAPGPPWPPFQ